MSERVLTLALQSLVLLGSAWLIVLLMRRASAALRHYVWTLALGFVLLLPLWPETQAVVPIEVAVAPTRIVVRGNEVGETPIDWLRLIWWTGVVGLITREVMAQLRGEWLKRRAIDCGRGYLLSPDLAVPAVCGLIYPKVLMPLESEDWAPERVEAVLAHERMHLLRRDLIWSAVGRLACAVYWMNPLVWLAVNAQHKECEQACDDGVVISGVAATDYAEHLVGIARNLNQQTLLEGGLSMAKLSTLEQRLKALLNPMTSHRPVSRGTLVLTFLLSLALLGPVAGLKLIAQQGGVRGVVKDAGGAHIADARVTLRLMKPASNQRVELVKTNEAGEFSFPSVPQDDGYSIVVEKPGFAALSNTMVKLGSAPLVFTLNLGGVKETVPPPPSPPVGASGPGPTRIRIGGNVQAAKIIHRVPPLYPADCRTEGVQGIVLLNAVISKEGDVLSLEPVNQFVDSRLRDEAIRSVKLWRYQPTLLNGNPVEIVTQIEVNFTLTK